MSEAKNDWMEAVIDACVCAHIGWNVNNPRETLNKLIDWETSVALDPRVSSAAQELINKGYAQGKRGPFYPHHTDLQGLYDFVEHYCAKDSRLIATAEAAWNYAMKRNQPSPALEFIVKWYSILAIAPERTNELYDQFNAEMEQVVKAYGSSEEVTPDFAFRIRIQAQARAEALEDVQRLMELDASPEDLARYVADELSKLEPH